MLVFAMTACSSSSSSNESGEKESKGGEKLEIFSWWTGAGEEDGLKALIALFQEKYQDIKVENTRSCGRNRNDCKSGIGHPYAG
jgi:glucose/mannose transport system substrate-binding protein